MILMAKVFIWCSFISLLLMIGASFGGNTYGWYEFFWTIFGFVQFSVMSSVVEEAIKYRKLMQLMQTKVDNENLN